MKDYTKQLAEFVEELRYESIPPEVTGTIKKSILDTLGCGLYGSGLPWGKIISEFVAETGGKGKSRIWGGEWNSSAPDAALANGTMVHGFELDDGYKAGRVHPGAVCVTSALAMSEEKGAVAGRDFITAVVAGYEVVTRVAKAVAGSHSVRGFHPVGTCGCFGAAASACKIMGLDKIKTANAFGLAGSQSAGLHAAQFGPMAKRFHAGRAAQSGVYAALLASKGFTGAVDILEQPYGGFCSAFADEFDLEALVTGLGEHYESGKIGLKYYCGAGPNQCAVDVIESLVRKQKVDLKEADKVVVKVDREAFLHVGWNYEPSGVTAGQMNLSYCLAAFLLEGRCFVEQFREGLLGDPRVLEMIRKKIRILWEPALDKFKGENRRMEIEIVWPGGNRWKEIGFIGKTRGTPANPLSTEEIVEKFRALSIETIGKKAASLIGEKVKALEGLDDIESLSSLLKSVQIAKAG
jgi:aconitate decarboxylase